MHWQVNKSQKCKNVKVIEKGEGQMNHSSFVTVIYWLTCLFADNIFFFFRILKNKSVLQKEWKSDEELCCWGGRSSWCWGSGCPRDHPVLHGGRHSELTIIHGWVGFHFNATWCKSLSISLSFITKFALFRKLLINFLIVFSDEWVSKLQNQRKLCFCTLLCHLYRYVWAFPTEYL